MFSEQLVGIRGHFEACDSCYQCPLIVFSSFIIF